jgi:hypothetical protein
MSGDDRPYGYEEWLRLKIVCLDHEGFALRRRATLGFRVYKACRDGPTGFVKEEV